MITKVFYFILLIFFIFNNEIEAKWGKSSSSKSSSSSHSSSHHSSSSSHSSPSYGWSLGSHKTSSGSSSYGWNTHSNSHSSGSPSYDWNTKSHSPSSYGKNTYSSGYGNHYGSGSSSYSSNHGYGKQFGSSGLGGNTYISNNYYGTNHGSSSSSSTGGFLTNALFGDRRSYRRRGYYNRRRYDERRRGSSNSNTKTQNWNENQDRSWRATTQNPYFLNKIPGGNKILPASAVIGAATALGLVTLLPLNVPANKPLMHCNFTDDDLAQTEIRIENNFIYQCVNDTIEITCPQAFDNSTTKFDCKNQIMNCSDGKEDSNDEIYCKNDSLFSNENLYCNSTTNFNDTVANETVTILNCFKGKLPDREASFIPTTTLSPEMTEKPSLSIGALIHIFLLKLINQPEVLERKSATTSEPEDPLWIPEALTIPPTETTTEGPYKWMMKIPFYENGTFGEKIEEVPEKVLKAHQKLNKELIEKGLRETEEMPSHYFKVYETTTTTEAPYKWMMKIPITFTNGTVGHELSEVSQNMINKIKIANEGAVKLGKEKPEETTIPSYYVKVYFTTESSVQNLTVNNLENTQARTTTEKFDDLKISKKETNKDD